MFGIYLSMLAMLETAEEKSKFEELFNLYEQDMFKTANSILKNEFDAEDAVHEAFTRVVNHLSKITDTSSPQTHAYLVIIVKNISINLYNDRKKTKNIDEFTDLEDDLSVEDGFFSRTDVETILNGAKSLSDDFYNILLLEQAGYKTKETAQLLGITYDSAWKRINRAKLKLKSLISTELMYNE